MIEISREHTISGKLETIEGSVRPIIQQLNANGFPIDIGIVEKKGKYCVTFIFLRSFWIKEKKKRKVE